jgi:hypothetical protein
MNNTVTDALQSSLQSNLVSTVNDAIAAGRDAVSFTYEQAPLVVKEVLTYNGICSGLYMLLGALVMYGGYRVIKWARKSYNDYDGSGSVPPDISVLGGMFGGVFPMVIGVAMLFINLTVLLQIVFAPRLYLIEYIANLVK